ncbi:MAG TPA: hypothetical protein VI933_04120 [archaeon]|nr:hypothetical protein [archaeon]
MVFRRKFNRGHFKRHKAEERNQIAFERVQTLSQIILGNPASLHAPRHMKTISAICRKNKVPFPRAFANRTCGKCGRYLAAGKTFFFRIKKGKPMKICICRNILKK